MINDFKLDNLSFIIIKRELFQKINTEEFVKSIYDSLGYKVKKIFGILGHPDFEIKSGKDIFYVEVKSNGDGMKVDQIEWIKNHPDKKVYCFFFIQKEQEKKLLKIRKKEQKEKEEFNKFSQEARKTIKEF